MILKIYKIFNDLNYTDEEKVFLWFLTHCFREVGWQETLTMDAFDYRRILFSGRKGDLVNQVAFPSHLRKYFNVHFVGNERVGISLSESVHEYVTLKPGPKDIGVHEVTIQSLTAQKVAIYLSACLNNMDQLFISEEEGGKYGLLIDKKSRFRNQRNKKQDYTQHSRFSFEQMFLNDQ